MFLNLRNFQNIVQYQFKTVMNFDSSSPVPEKKTYKTYNRETRLQLIKLVEEERMSTAEAGRRLGIKQTSACRIINCYKKNNHVFQKKCDRQLREAVEAQQKLERTKVKSSEHKDQTFSPIEQCHQNEVQINSSSKKTELHICCCQKNPCCERVNVYQKTGLYQSLNGIYYAPPPFYGYVCPPFWPYPTYQ